MFRVRMPRYTRFAAAAATAVLVMQQAACKSAAPATDVGPGEAVAALSPPTTVTALGRVEPKNRIRRIAGPSRPSVVIGKLLVEEGDRVAAGQPIAILDTLTEDQSKVARAKAEVTHAQRALDRILALTRQGISAVAQRDDAQLALEVANAELAGAQAAVALDTVEAPAAGQIVAIHTRRGERVGSDGIAELAENDHMYVVAEVYETDIGRVEVGQHATIHSPALTSDLTGSVERIGMKIGKLDLLDTDPVARTDARVVEVHIKLDDTQRAASLSNLQVEVTIVPATESAPGAAQAASSVQ
jgi:HlyD family secretion protein